MIKKIAMTFWYMIIGKENPEIKDLRRKIDAFGREYGYDNPNYLNFSRQLKFTLHFNLITSWLLRIQIAIILGFIIGMFI